ncbi:MAG: lipocalin family protein [Chitinophagales bacterium]|nr:lipocalin family protein [Bacteroidota bacterium]MCB9043179.1 lipocalin family protein [Chitinophagales bacterium]
MKKNQDESTIFGIFHRAAIPEGATAVHDFVLEKYLGKWYEIARLDYYWENKNLTNVFAEYSLREDGMVAVKNSGFDEKKEKWEESEGKAKFRGDNTLAAFDVSFFGPIYGGYNVVSVDDDYQYALVFGRNLDYIWLLSRTTEMPEHIKEKYLKIAQNIGYETDKLTWVSQDKNQ